MKSILALPGDAPVMGPLGSGCGERVQNPLDDSVRGMANSFQCQGFSKENVGAMCDCMKETYGNSIKENEDYKRFMADLSEFDTFETAMVEFNQDVASIEMANLVNFIAGQDSTIDQPFGPNGACSQKFMDHENRLNSVDGVHYDLSPINYWMNSHKSEDYLMSQGVDSGTLDKALSEFWRVLPSQNSTVITGRSEEENTNRIFKYLYGASYERVGEESVHQRLSSNLPKNIENSEFHSLSKKDAVEILCNGLVARFEEMRVENEADKPVWVSTLIDRENTLTDRALYSTDIDAFRGLRSRYVSANDSESEHADLYFNQRFCDSYKAEESNGKVTRPSDPDITGASDEVLKLWVEEGNDFFEMVGEQIEAGNVQFQEKLQYKSESEARLKEKLSELGLDADAIVKKLNELKETDDPKQELQKILSENSANEIPSEKLQETLELAKNFHTDNHEFIKVATRYASVQEGFAVAQEKYEGVLRELLHRKGSMKGLEDFLGKDLMRSRTARYYASFDKDISDDYIGPRLPVHAHMNTGNKGLFSNIADRIKEIARRNNNAKSIVESLVDQGTKQGEILGDFRRTMAETVTGGFFTNRRAGSLGSTSRSKDSRYGKKSKLLSYSGPNSSNRGNQQQLKDTQVINRSKMPKIVTPTSSESSLFGESLGGPMGNGTIANNQSTQFLNNQKFRGPLEGPEEDSSSSKQLSGQSIDALERRLNDLDNLGSQATRRQDSDGKNTIESEEDLALRAEIARLRGQLDSLRDASKELEQRGNKISSNFIENAPRNFQTQVNRGNRNQGSYSSNRSRSPAAISSAGQSSDLSVAANSGAPVSDASSSFSSSTSIEIPYRAQKSSSSGPSLTASDDEASSSFSSGVSLKLINGSLGFAVVNNSDINTRPVEISIDFLSLPDAEKASFIESFFEERGETTAVLRQKDGKIVLIEKSNSFRPAKKGEIGNLELEDVKRNQADVIYRVKTMNNTLDDFLSTLSP